MDGIKARIRGRFSKRKSGSFVSTPRDSIMENSFDGARDQQQQQQQCPSSGHSQAAGASSRATPDSVVETACNSQQPAHHAEPAASVTTASTGSSDARTITTASSIDHPRQNFHDAHLEVSRVGKPHTGITPDR